MDKDNIDLKSLWQQQKIGEPDIQVLFLRLRKVKNKGLRMLVMLNFLLISTTAIILCIWYYFKPQFISTKIGIILTIASMIVYSFFNNKLWMNFDKIDEIQSNSSYLQRLVELKNKQKFIQTTLLSVYFILLSLGLCLYMYEYAIRMSPNWLIFSYSSLLVWIAVNWFYFRPIIIKKQQKNLDELIKKFEKITNQLKED